jgi:hypothetical protein
MDRRLIVRLISICCLVLCILYSENANAGWSSMTSGTSEYMRGIWGTSGIDIFAVGDGGTVLHYNGMNWNSMSDGSILSPSTTQTDSVNKVTAQNLWGVWGSSGNDVFVTGFSGTIAHYDGINWTTMNSGVINGLGSVWGTSGNDVFAVGSYGTILHYDGTSWNALGSGLASLSAVWGTSGENVYAVGNSGIIINYNGLYWLPMSSGTTGSLNAIWGTSETDIFAVGDGGTILHFNGTNWTPMISGTTERLNGIWGSSTTDVFAVGEAGTILHFNGIFWTPMVSGSTTYLYDVWGSSNNDVFVVGGEGTILHYDGVSGTCLAELIYGEHSEKTELLRYLRDHVLNQTPEGREIIKLYYHWSPVMVNAMEEDEEFKEEVKAMIDGVLELIGGGVE